MAQSAAKKSPAKQETKQDAIALLKADHRTVEELFEKYENARSSSQKQTLAKKICTELVIHTMIEEEVFYPALRGEIEEDMIDEAYVEHDGAKVLVAELLAGGPDDDFYDAKVKVLSEEIKHHVHEEEMRDGMFAQARKSDVDMDALGEKLLARKEELMAKFKDGPPTPVTKTLRTSAEQGDVEAAA